MCLFIFLTVTSMGDLTPLIGEWKYVSLTVQGKAVEVKKHRMVISKDGTISIFEGETKVVAGRITRVDQKQIDCILAARSEYDGRFAPEYPQEGIYEVTKTKWKMCRTRNAQAGPRPTEFASPPNKDWVLEELERVK